MKDIDIWKVIEELMNTHIKKPQDIADLTGYPLKYIQKGLNNECPPIDDTFLRKLVTIFNPTSGRNESYNETAISKLTREELIKLLQPPPAMPPDSLPSWKRSNVGWAE